MFSSFLGSVVHGSGRDADTPYKALGPGNSGKCIPSTHFRSRRSSSGRRSPRCGESIPFFTTLSELTGVPLDLAIGLGEKGCVRAVILGLGQRAAFPSAEPLRLERLGRASPGRRVSSAFPPARVARAPSALSPGSAVGHWASYLNFSVFDGFSVKLG